MFPKVLSGHSYSHSGELFSRLLFLDENKNDTSILHIVPNSTYLQKYHQIAKELEIPYISIATYYDLVHLDHTQEHIYAITIEELEKNIDTRIVDSVFLLKTWDTCIMEELIKTLQAFHYDFSEYEKAWSYYKKWDTIHIVDIYDVHIQISFWGDEIEDIQKDNISIGQCVLSSIKDIGAEDIPDKFKLSLLDYLASKEILSIVDHCEFHYLYENIHDAFTSLSSLDVLPNDTSEKKHNHLWVESLNIQNIEALRDILWKSSHECYIYTRHKKTIQEFLDSNNFWHISVKHVSTHLLTSFFKETTSSKKVFYICDDVLGNIFIKKRVRKKLSADVDLLLKIQSGDFVVHIDHGIWVFKGIVKKELWNVSKEYMEISYEKEDRLFVPITEVHRVSKYVWSENPKLTPLSWKLWERKMKKVHEDIKEIAEGILQSFAERKLRSGGSHIFFKDDIHAFQGSFPYTYTEDQAESIGDIFSDMQSNKNMDRLVVWDVGFWKTEIAFNAAYMAMKNKKQVVLISPLVVLAHEHYNKAIERFLDFWINVEILTRLQSTKHANRVLKWLKDGSIDLVIGTHRLLSDKLEFKDLWLMIVDEEHKFWVVDKEKIKKMKANIDILSLSATPIPRSLNLALSGVRDISLLKTPPSGRKSIETSVIRFNDQVIINAWNREFKRGGQIFFVHNRVANIEAVKKQLQGLFPKKKIIITHGQLEWEELENRIIDFKNKKYDILLSTTVIENGIDFSNVNTIFINECQSFWISQIHQLRWRVGRSNKQWYCYLLYRREHLDGEAAKRIQTIVDYSYLWAGFELAMKDLEIRWWWDILGVRQSGQSKEIWVSLFLKMLEEKIEELKNEQTQSKDSQKKEVKIKTVIDLMITALIPDSYFLNETDKLNFYREIEFIENISDLEYLKNSFFENNKQDIPPEAENLFSLIEAGLRAKDFNITHIKKLWINYQIDFHETTTLDELKAFLSLDNEVKFHVVDVTRIRCETKGFANDQLFIQYLLQLMQGSIWNKRIKLVKKANK